MVHDTGQWPLIDEYGMNINPSSYTEVAITEVSIDVIQYTRDILKYLNQLEGKFDNNLIFQTKLQRQEYPHPSNCTQSWKRTDFYDLAKLAFEHDGRELDYKLAVISLLPFS